MKSVALVTGAAGDIGSALCQMLHAEGCDLLLVDIDAEGMDAIKRDVSGAESIVCDLSRAEDLRRLCKRIESLEDSLDYAFINAGIIHPGDIVDLTSEEVDRQIDINLRSAIHLNQACARRMKSQGHGHILNNVSMGGHHSFERQRDLHRDQGGLAWFSCGNP